MTENRRLSPELLRQIKEAQEKKRLEQKRSWHWTYSVTIIGLVAGSILTVIMMLHTLLSLTYLFAGLVAIATLAFIVQWKMFYNSGYIEKHFRIPVFSYILYCFFGIAGPLTGILLTVNMLGASKEEDIEQHRVVGFDHAYVIDSNFLTVLKLEDNAYENDPWMRSIAYTDAIKWRTMPFYTIVFNKGLLGIRIFKTKRMMEDPEHPYDSSQPTVVEGLYQVTRPDTSGVSNETDSLREE